MDYFFVVARFFGNEKGENNNKQLNTISKGDINLNRLRFGSC
jgi:hypothetical protein